MSRRKKENPFIVYRRETGNSMRELADDLELSVSSISLYESGKRKPKYETCIRLSDLYYKKTHGRILMGVINYYYPKASQNVSNKIAPYGNRFKDWRRTSKNLSIRIFTGPQAWGERNRFWDCATNFGKDEILNQEYLPLCLVCPPDSSPRELSYPVRGLDVVVIESGVTREDVLFSGVKHLESTDELVWALLRDGAALVVVLNDFVEADCYRKNDG